MSISHEELRRWALSAEDTNVVVSTRTLSEMARELLAAREALQRVATEHQAYYIGPDLSPAQSQYTMGVTDGHRCAAKIARTYLARSAGGPKDGGIK